MKLNSSFYTSPIALETATDGLKNDLTFLHPSFCTMGQHFIRRSILNRFEEKIYEIFMKPSSYIRPILYKLFLIWYLKNFPDCFNQSDYFERKQQHVHVLL